jgi:D-hydroxyproline dehydrogenase subunit beta
MNKLDLTIVGGGIVGCAIAYHALKAGHSVHILDKDETPLGASVRNFGLVATGSIVPFEGVWRGYANRSAEVYRELGEVGLPVSEQPTLYTAQNPHQVAILAQVARKADGFGVKAELLDGAALQKAYPALSATHNLAGLRFPKDLSVSPAVFVPAFHEYLKRQGVRFTTLGKAATLADLQPYTEEPNQRLILATGAEVLTGLEGLYHAQGIQLCHLQMYRIRPSEALDLGYTLATGWSMHRYHIFATSEADAALLEGDELPEAVKAHGIHLLLKPQADGSFLFGDTHHYTPYVPAGPFPTEWHTEADGILTAELHRHFPQVSSWAFEQQWLGYYPTHPTRGSMLVRFDDQTLLVSILGGKGMSTAFGFAEAFLEELD